MVLSVQAARIIQVLEEAGHESWCVGGFVRDALLGRRCVDVDIATSASWQEVKHVCENQGYRTRETGIAHGTITVIADDCSFEVTSYRADGEYSDARRPDTIAFVRTIEEDLARRDFTMNALAFHPSRGMIDPFGGLSDIRRGVIRAVGNPGKRFSEDALRILRACRFVSQLGFTIDGATYQGMMENKGQLFYISAERITQELEALLLGSYVHDALLSTCDVLAAVLPEIVAMKSFEQHTPYHIYDVLEHTAYVMQHTPAYPLARWAALFHDMGKPAAFFKGENGVGHFYGHAKISMLLAQGVMGRLSISSSLANKTITLVKYHDDVIEATPKAVKRALARLGGDVELFRALCDLKRGDALAQAPSCAERVSLVDELEVILGNILSADEAFSLKKLAISGADVMAAGIPQGPCVGRALSEALDAVIDEQVPNNREALLTYVNGRAINDNGTGGDKGGGEGYA